MRLWHPPPAFPDPEQTRQARVLWRLMRAMVVLLVLGATVGLLDPRNSVSVTLFFYSLLLLWLVGVATIMQRGKVTLAAWILSLFYWGVIAFVTLAFGGLQGQNASTFAVCTLLIGSLVGGRAAIGMAVASSAWCGLVAYLELRNSLPFDLGPYTPANAWAAVSITVFLTSLLLHEALTSLTGMHQAANLAAAERDEALRRSIQSQKMELVGNVTSGIAHDLNNLLTVIVNTVELLQSEPHLKEGPARELLHDLEIATSRSALMTTQLLAFGRKRVEGGELLDFALLLEEAAKLLPRLLGSTIQVVVQTERGSFARISRSAFEQILLNLSVNARDAMPRGGTLYLDVRVSGEDVVLRARDTGVGMNQEQRERLFEPFFTTKPTGTGLGLSTTQQLVKQFGGRIEVLSEPEKGSQFVLYFPRVAAPLPAPIAGDSQSLVRAPAVAGGRILLVEDDPLVRRSLARMLTAEGYDVTAVADGREALSLVETMSDWGCIVTDISMQHVDGDQLSQELHQRWPDLPVLIISGNREPTLSNCSHPKRLFMPKPVTRTDLCDAIARLSRS